MTSGERLRSSGGSSANSSSHGAPASEAHTPRTGSADEIPATASSNGDSRLQDCSSVKEEQHRNGLAPQRQRVVRPDTTHSSPPDLQHEGTMASNPADSTAGGSTVHASNAGAADGSFDQQRLPPPQHQPAASTEAPRQPSAASVTLSPLPEHSHRGRTPHASLDFELLHGMPYHRAALWHISRQAPLPRLLAADSAGVVAV